MLGEMSVMVEADTQRDVRRAAVRVAEQGRGFVTRILFRVSTTEAPHFGFEEMRQT